MLCKKLDNYILYIKRKFSIQLHNYHYGPNNFLQKILMSIEKPEDHIPKTNESKKYRR